LLDEHIPTFPTYCYTMVVVNIAADKHID